MVETISLLTDALAEARERTLALVASLSDADVETQHDAIMSPLVWDLAHIAAYEDLWLVHRLGGAPLLRPELAAMYDAVETPRRGRGELPLLDRAGALDYLDDVRERALTVLTGRAPDPVLHEMVLQHEMQHGETMLQAIALARLERAPALEPPLRPESPPLRPSRRGARRRSSTTPAWNPSRSRAARAGSAPPPASSPTTTSG